MPNNNSELQSLVNQIFPDLLAIRRHLHANPELSFEEKNTAEFIVKELKKIGIPFQENIGGYGIIGLIEGNNPQQQCLALRADMDALPIKEKNDIPYKSLNEGVMHACGHDVHSTCLLGAAKILWQLKNQINGTIKLIFQPGEEKSPGGASLMIKDGVLDNPKVDKIIGLHVYPEQKSGTLGFRPGYYMASCDEIHITIIGKGGHAALPHKTIDPIHISALLLTELQVLFSRKNNVQNPSVLSFGSIHGGEVNNVIPEKVHLKGTFRTFDTTWRKEALALIDKTIQNICDTYGASYELNIPPGYPSLYNNPELTEAVIKNSQSIIGTENVKALDLRMTGEDFSFYAQEIPACFFRLGTNENDEKYLNPVHHPEFDIHEESIKIGVQTLVYNALELLK